MSRSRVSHYTKAAELLLCGLLVFLPWALGSAPTWTLWPLVLVSIVTLGLAAYGAHRQKQHLGAPLFLLFPAVAALACLTQVVPLPPSWLQALSPLAGEWRDFALVPLGLDRLRPISMDAPATWRELAKALSYAAILLASVQLGRSHTFRRQMFHVVAATGTSLALTGFAHELVGADTLFGVVAWPHASLLTPFGNPNHLAGYLILTSSLALGLVVSASSRTHALAWGACYVVSGSAVLFSTSRGGVVFFLLSQVLLGLLLWWSRRKEPQEETPTLRPWGVLALGVFCMFSVGLYVGIEKLSQDWTAPDVAQVEQSKAALWPMFWQAARAHAKVGMGRGAFEVAFTRFQTAFPQTTFTHPENFVLQWANEFGFGVTVVLLALGGWTLFRLYGRKNMSPMEWAVVAALTGVSLHNLFDFNWEFPATASTSMALLGVLLHSKEEELLFRFPWKSLRWGTPVVGCVMMLSLWAGRSTVAAEESALVSSILEKQPLRDIRQQALKAIDTHPSNYAFFNLLGKLYSSRKEAQEALAFANRALFLKPQDAEAHRIAARALLRMGNRSQAFLEYRLTWQAGLRDVLGEGLQAAETSEEYKALVDNQPQSFWEMLTLLYAFKPEPARKLLEEVILERDSTRISLPLWQLAARMRVDAHDYEAAMAAVNEAWAMDSSNVQNLLAKASVFAARGDLSLAIDELSKISPAHPENVDLGFALAQYLGRARREKEAREVLARLRPFVMNSPHRMRLAWMEAASYEREERPAKALMAYQEALSLSPDTVELHYGVARMYEEVGRYAEATVALREGLKRDTPKAQEGQQSWLLRLEEKQKGAELSKDVLLLNDTPPEDE